MSLVPTIILQEHFFHLCCACRTNLHHQQQTTISLVNNKHTYFNIYHSLGKIQQSASYFSQKKDFGISCKLSPVKTICMKCQILFPEKIKKNISEYNLLMFLSRVLSVKSAKYCVCVEVLQPSQPNGVMSGTVS